MLVLRTTNFQGATIRTFTANNNRIRSSPKIIKCYVYMEHKSKSSYPKQRFGYREDRPKLKGGT